MNDPDKPAPSVEVDLHRAPMPPIERLQEMTDITGLVLGAWIRNPEMRLGQVIVTAAHASPVGRDPFGMTDLFYVADDELAQGLRDMPKRA